MWGKKTSNRRSRRYTLLNVKLPVEKERQQRLRWVARVGGFILGAVALFFGVWHGGQWVMQAGFYQNEKFSICQVDIRTDGVIAPGQLQRWARVKTGDNLFDLDLVRIKRDLELVPLVESAAVDRVLPDQLRIRVTERVPVAQVVQYLQGSDGKLTQRRYWVDRTGYVIPPLDPQLAAKERPRKWLPALVGLDQVLLQPGHTLASPQVRAALQLIARFDLSPMAGLEHLRQIDVSGRETMEIRTWRNAQVTLSLHGQERQLNRWRQIFDLGRQHRRAVFTLDLSIKNNLPVRWVMAPAS